MIEHGQLDDSLKSKLRNKILAGNLRPGQRIKESEIADSLVNFSLLKYHPRDLIVRIKEYVKH